MFPYLFGVIFSTALPEENGSHTPFSSGKAVLKMLRNDSEEVWMETS